MPDDTPTEPRQTIADLRRELARYKAERDEAIEREQALAEVLGVINSSPGDLAPVFDAILEKATRLCDASSGVLWTVDGELSRAVALHGVPPAFAEYLREPLRMDAATGLYRVQHGQPFVATVDMADEELYRAGHPQRRAIVDLGRARSAVRIPLIKDDRPLGAFVLYRQEVRPFTDQQIALLQNFAAQAVIAMENARLITETREALDQQTATAEVLQVINSSPGDLAPVFDAMLDKAMRLCAAAFGAFYAYDGEFFQAMAFRGMPPALVDFFREPFRAGRGFATGRLADGELIVHIADITAQEPSPGIRATVELGGGRTVIWLALRKEETLLGFISMYRQEVRPFTDKQIALLQNFAAQAVIAMENARLMTETREALEQQTATAEVLQVINSSPGDLAPVFEAILEKAHSLCGAAHGSLTVYDGERFYGVATRGMPEAFAILLRRPRPASGLLQGGLLAGERLVHIPDMTQAVTRDAGDSGITAAGIELGIRTFLMVPLRKDGVLLGYIAAHRREVRPFSEKEIALLQNFAAQAVIAMENARLLGELRERTEEIAGWNKELEARVAAQLAELERTGKLRRFLAPQLADLIVAQGNEAILEIASPRDRRRVLRSARVYRLCRARRAGRGDGAVEGIPRNAGADRGAVRGDARPLFG